MRRPRADRPSIASRVAGWLARRGSFAWELEVLNRQTDERDELPAPLREAIERVLAEYAGMFTGDDADEGEIDPGLENLAWEYGRLTGWNANTELDGGEWAW